MEVSKIAVPSSSAPRVAQERSNFVLTPMLKMPKYTLILLSNWSLCILPCKKEVLLELHGCVDWDD